MTPNQGETALNILRARDGYLTLATMNNGQVYRIVNIAWGLDDGADFHHITTNISPLLFGLPVDFFHTNEVRSLSDDAGTLLFSA